MLVLCVLSNLLLVLSTEERRTFLKLLWGLVSVWGVWSPVIYIVFVAHTSKWGRRRFSDRVGNGNEIWNKWERELYDGNERD